MNPFICDIIEDGFPISEIILSEKATGELELLEMKEDQELQMLQKARKIMIEFWKLKESCLSSIFDFWYNNTCESLYSTMKFVNSKHGSQLTNQHLTEGGQL